MDINMPRYGTTMEAGEIVEWFVKEGDAVKVGDNLCEISSEKLTNILESPVDGTVEKLLAEEGDEVAVGAPILQIASE
ncbi:MAG: biotin/lipoyl-containing protein [Saccharofermentanales bacterium]|jgi:pyruvate/2-oxoglutarate dehydrogenase complex dihydrolipoamide acyltransferase (E2) component